MIPTRTFQTFSRIYNPPSSTRLSSSHTQTLDREHASATTASEHTAARSRLSRAPRTSCVKISCGLLRRPPPAQTRRTKMPSPKHLSGAVHSIRSNEPRRSPSPAAAASPSLQRRTHHECPFTPGEPSIPHNSIQPPPTRSTADPLDPAPPPTRSTATCSAADLAHMVTLLAARSAGNQRDPREACTHAFDISGFFVAHQAAPHNLP